MRSQCKVVMMIGVYLLTAAGLLAGSLLADADAVVICQKNKKPKKIKLRAGTCKQSEGLAALSRECVGAPELPPTPPECLPDEVLTYRDSAFECRRVAADGVVLNGKLVEAGVYEVHTRVLWSLGMLTDPSYLDAGGYFTYNEHPKDLVYGPNRTGFLQPLKGYGIPEVQEGATRYVRLYVNYGHQMHCLGTPTVRISDVEFSLPLIGGYFGAMGAGWSDYKEYSEYSHIGHSTIQVYLKDFAYGGPDCGPFPGTGRPKGVMYRVEAHFYDVVE